MLSNFEELFKILGFNGEIIDDGKTLILNYVEDNDLGLYKFLKIRDAFDVSSDGLINEVGYLYNFAVCGNDFIISEYSSEEA